jgi:hypothetical protein
MVDEGCSEPIAGMVSWVRDERLCILRIEHGGISRVRNAGMVASIGSDDEVIAYGATMIATSSSSLAIGFTRPYPPLALGPIEMSR